MKLKRQLFVNANPRKKPLLSSEEEERLIQFLLGMSAISMKKLLLQTKSRRDQRI